MSEKFSENSPEVAEKERPPRFKTIKNEIVEVGADGSKIERAAKCNGTTHRRCTDKIYYDANGEVEMAEQLLKEELGPCDCAK